MDDISDRFLKPTKTARPVKPKAPFVIPTATRMEPLGDVPQKRSYLTLYGPKTSPNRHRLPSIEASSCVIRKRFFGLKVAGLYSIPTRRTSVENYSDSFHPGSHSSLCKYICHRNTDKCQPFLSHLCTSASFPTEYAKAHYTPDSNTPWTLE